MGIGMVLIAWTIVGTILAGVAAVVLGGATAWLTHGVQRWRRSAILAAAALPFLCFAWAGAVFVFQAIVNEAVFHRDPGLGDAWETPLPNGYALLMIDETDHGSVYNPKTQVPGGVSEQEDAPFGVRVLQVQGRYIIGGLDSKAGAWSNTNDTRVDSYFLLDTQSSRRTNFPTYDALLQAASQVGIQPHLEPIAKVYSDYRFTWFDKVSAFLFFVPPLIALILLIWWVLRLRKTANRLIRSLAST
jgi:hypothetical protein